MAICAVITIGFFAVIAMCFDMMYCLNDDLMIQSILSGGFSAKPSGMSVYLSQPLSSLLSFLYSIIPGVPWLGAFFCTCYIVGFFLILYRLFLLFHSKKEQILAAVICISAFLALCLNSYVMIHYTVVAAITGGCGIFMMVTDNLLDKPRFGRRIVSVILLWFCYLIRTKVFFLLIPFILCTLALDVMGDHSKKHMKQLISYLLVLFGGLMILIGVNQFCYSEEAWQQYLAYNDARTEVYDYRGIWTDIDSLQYYQEQKITEEQLLMYQSYNIMLDDNAGNLQGTQILQKIADNPNIPGTQVSIVNRIKNALWIYKDQTIHSEDGYLYNYLAIGMYLLLGIVILRAKRYWHCLILLLSGGARSSLFLYLYAFGRYPERVTLSIYLVEFLFLMGYLLYLTLTSRDSPKKRYVQESILLLVFLLISVNGISVTIQDCREQKSVNEAEDVVYSYMESHPENFYFLDVYTTVYHTRGVFDPMDKEPENYLYLGGWMTGSPLVTMKKEYFGIEEIKDALLYADNALFITRDGTGMTAENLEKCLGVEEGYFQLVDMLQGGNDNFLIYQAQ